MSLTDGVSDVIGAILLVSLVVIAVSIVAVIIVSQPLPEDIPKLDAFAENRSNTIYIIHNGGDPLQLDSMEVFVNGYESSFSLEDGNEGSWSVGKILKVDYAGPEMPKYLELVYDRGSTQAVIFRASFCPTSS